MALVGVAPSILIPSDRTPLREHRALTVGAAGSVTRLSGHTLWRAGSQVSLRGPLRVPAGASLDIEAGVSVEAAAGASIVVERNGRLNMTGTITEPVVLTCPSGARTPGCWDGLVVLGQRADQSRRADEPGRRSRRRGWVSRIHAECRGLRG